MRSSRSLLLAAVVLPWALACGGELEPNAPPDDDGPPAGHPATGALRATAATTGTDGDPDGYTLMIDGTARGTLGAPVTVSGLAAGSVSVGLGGVAANCTVAGENPRAVAVVAGTTKDVAFAVACTALPPTTGTIRLTTSTIGSDLDPDGFIYRLDNGPGIPVAANATVDIPGASAALHSLSFSGVLNSCSVVGGDTHPVTVTVGAVAAVSISVVCAPRVGDVAVTVTTTGRAPDPDGYTVQVDGGAPQVVAANGVTIVPSLHEGSHTFTAAGEAGHCTITSPSVRTAAVTYQGTVPVAFDVHCPGTLSGRILLNDSPYLASIDPDGTGYERATTSPVYARIPRVSPDGLSILYVENDAFGPPTLQLVRYDGRQRRDLLPDFCAWVPEWSPDGSRIVFNACLEQAVWIINADGTGAHRISPAAITGDSEPAWSPDGTRIVFTNAGQMGIMNADGTGRTMIPLPVRAVHPDWSASGIAFAGDAGIFTPSDIYTVQPDGSQLTKLSTMGIGKEPRWSPDGTQIAFIQAGFYLGEIFNGIYVMNRDGSSSHLIFQSGDPSWAP